MPRKKIKDWEIRKEFIRRNLDFFKSTFFVNELGVNSKNIMDVAALDFDKNIFYGFEIKSEADNLQRLYKQLSTYVTFFNIVYVVSHIKHTEAILALIENNPFMRNVGYIEVTPIEGNNDEEASLNFKELRKAKFTAPRFDTFIRNLDMEELTVLCEGKGQYLGWESKKLLVDKIKRMVTMDEIYEHMKSKAYRYYYKTCPKCGSHLYYNKTNRKGKLVSRCFECECEIE